MQAAVAGPLREEAPDWVLVYGDTNSTLAGAHAASAAEVPLAHVEAGLRSGDLSMPEERNRIEVDRLSALLFAPDERSRDQLAAEGVPGRTEVVGDVMADATRLFEPIARKRVEPVSEEPYDVLTIHREANTEPERLRRLIETLSATGRTFVFPVHPRTRKVLDEHGIEPAPQLHASSRRSATSRCSRSSPAPEPSSPTRVACRRRPTGSACRASRCGPRRSGSTRSSPGANTLVDPDDPSSLPEVLEHASFPADAPQLYGDGRASRWHR